MQSVPAAPPSAASSSAKSAGSTSDTPPFSLFNHSTSFLLSLHLYPIFALGFINYSRLLLGLSDYGSIDESYQGRRVIPVHVTHAPPPHPCQGAPRPDAQGEGVNVDWGGVNRARHPVPRAERSWSSKLEERCCLCSTGQTSCQSVDSSHRCVWFQVGQR